MFRITLRELILIAAIVCIAAGWMRDRQGMNTFLEKAESCRQSYNDLEILLKHLDERTVYVSWKDDYLSLRDNSMGSQQSQWGIGPLREFPPFSKDRKFSDQ